MKHKNVALEQGKMNEVIEIKLEPVEIYSETLGVDDINWELTNRMKYEHNYAKNVEMQLEEINLEKELNNAKLEVTKITEQLILKDETDCDTFMDENPEMVCNRISTDCVEVKEGATFSPTADITKIEKLVKSEEMDIEMLMDMKHCQAIDPTQFSFNHSTANAKPDILLESAVEWKISRKQRHVICKKGSKKSFSCYNCNYTAYHKHHLISHMEGHKNAYVNSSSRKPDICIHCGMTFKSRKILDEHTIEKHPKFIASVSYKIYECTHCAYKTIFENKLSKHILKHSNLTKHMLKHPEIAGRYKFKTCIHCNATFKTKLGLNSHIVRKHPDFIASVSRKIHECTLCAYKTVYKHRLAQHMLSHPETAQSYKFHTCIHCYAIFMSKQKLNNHMVKKHPDFIESVSAKIHNCTHCPYKTIYTANLAKHMLKHLGTPERYNFRTCIHCNATFKSNRGLDDHIVRKHTDFIASVSGKIHGCTLCSYKTILKYRLARHMLTHQDLVGSYELSTCIYCNATFKDKLNLDDHTIKKHPDFIASVSSKIHKCRHCTFETTLKRSLVRHMLKHPKIAGRYKFSACEHCSATFTSKQSLDDHIVRKHPDFIASVSGKIHGCTHCTFKTGYKSDLTKHMLKHSDAAGRYKFSSCLHCNATFKSKQGLDYHIVKKHPDFIASVSNKIYECTHCTYKTTLKYCLTRHMLNHPDTADTSSAYVYTVG